MSMLNEVAYWLWPWRNVRMGKRGAFCNASWGWKGATYCTRARLTGWHFGKHRDADGVRF